MRGRSLDGPLDVGAEVAGDGEGALEMPPELRPEFKQTEQGLIGVRSVEEAIRRLQTDGEQFTARWDDVKPSPRNALSESHGVVVVECDNSRVIVDRLWKVRAQ